MVSGCFHVRVGMIQGFAESILADVAARNSVKLAASRMPAVWLLATALTSASTIAVASQASSDAGANTPRSVRVVYPSPYGAAAPAVRSLQSSQTQPAAATTTSPTPSFTKAQP